MIRPEPMRYALIVSFALLAATPASAGSIGITAAPLTTAADGSSWRASDARLEFLAGFELTSDSAAWGGISGASISADGRVLTAISDFGTWFRLTLTHDAAGRLDGVAAAASGRLKDEHGDAIASKSVGDAEALMRSGDGSYYVSFEGWHRLWRYKPASDPLLATATREPRPKGMKDLPSNEGVEAATVLPDGRFLLLSEGGRTQTGDLRGWLGMGDRWAEVGLVPTGAFRPTDLAMLPSGDLLLLERRVSLFGGFSARLSVIPAATIAPGARLVGRELATIARPLPVDNFEAVTAHPAADGAVFIYMLSDNNFSGMERTLLLQFRWRP